MVAAVAHEIALGPEILPFWEPRRAREIGLIGHRKAEEIAVELAAFLDLVDIKSEMAEAADLERPIEQPPADIVTLGNGGHDWFPPAAFCARAGLLHA